MHVFGELLKAQLEQIAATTTTPAATGRVYSDITNPLAAVPMYYNGTSWRTIVLGQSSAFISQNSGKACTVDWSTGLMQRVVLTDNAVISFSNPQAGQTHTLVVSQAPVATTAANYLYKLNMINQECSGNPYQPTKWLKMGESAVAQWYYSSGVRAAYATIQANVVGANTSFLPAGAPQCCDLSPDGKVFFIAHATTPYGSTIPLEAGRDKPFIGITTGCTAFAGTGVAAAYSPDGNAAFFVSGTSPYIQSRPTGAGFATGQGQGFLTSSVYANPATLPAGAGHCVAVHPTGAWVVVGHDTTPFMSAYPFSHSGFGAKLSNPATLPAAAVDGVAWSPLGDFLAASVPATPYIQVWPFTFAAGTGSFGSIVANPSTLPAGVPSTTSSGKHIAWRPQGDYIAMVLDAAPYLYVVAFNRATGAFGSSVTIGYTFPATPSCVQWTPDGQYLICGTSSSPYLIVLDFSASTIGASAVALDGTGIGQTINDLSVGASGDWVACALNTSPYLKVISLPTKVRDYLRL